MEKIDHDYFNIQNNKQRVERMKDCLLSDKRIGTVEEEITITDKIDNTTRTTKAVYRIGRK